jgi:hypothetical protein
MKNRAIPMKKIGVLGKRALAAFFVTALFFSV